MAFDEKGQADSLARKIVFDAHTAEALVKANANEKLILVRHETSPEDVGGMWAAQGILTSTGGMTGKRYGRIGDSPIIGAGTYADDRSCAVSATGHGEVFIRAAVAHDICARMRFGGRDLHDAVREVVLDELPALDGEGGVIAIDAKGEIAMEFNSEGMFRASRREGEDARIAIYRPE